MLFFIKSEAIIKVNIKEPQEVRIYKNVKDQPSV